MDGLGSTLRDSVEEGVHRLHRTGSSLLATGAVGGTDVSGHFVERGVGFAPFRGAVLTGIIIALMTWMQMGSGLGGRLVAAVAAAFLLAYGELGQVVVASEEPRLVLPVAD